jgi:hypothetical protein
MDTEAEQLVKMDKVFGEEHAACTAIWEGLFIGEASAPRPLPKIQVPPWAAFTIYQLRLNSIWDSVINAWA